MSRSLEEIRLIVLRALGDHPRDTGGDAWISGQELGQLTGLSPAEINDAVSLLRGFGYVDLRTAMGTAPFDFRTVNITARGRYELERTRPQSSSPPVEDLGRGSTKMAGNDRVVWVVHGRNEAARKSMYEFLRAIGLDPREWSQAVVETAEGSPYVGEVIERAFSKAQAIVAMMTPDDEARLRQQFLKADDPEYERKLSGQPRQNVLFEAGMAFGHDSKRTILVELGKLRLFSDIFGRHVIRLDNSIKRRQEFADRLKSVGCAVRLDGTDWHDAGDFEQPVASETTGESSESLSDTAKPARPQSDSRISDAMSTALVLHLLFSSAGVSWFFFSLFDPSQAQSNSVLAIVGFAIVTLVVSTLRSWKTDGIVQWCKRKFQFLLLGIGAAPPMALALEYSISLYPLISHISFETQLHGVFLRSMQMLGAACIGGAALFAPGVSVKNAKHKMVSWILGHLKLFRRVSLAYVLLATVVLSVVACDTVVPVFTPKVESHESFYKSQWEYDPLGFAKLVISSEYALPVPNNMTCHAYRLVEDKYSISTPFIPLVKAVYLKNPSPFPDLIIGPPVFYLSDEWKKTFASVSNEAELKSLDGKDMLWFRYSRGKALNISYWKEIPVPGLTVTYLQKSSESIGNDAFSERYVFVVRNLSGMQIELLGIDFDRFRFAVVDPNAIRAYVNGTFAPYTSLLYRYRLNLGVWPRIPPRSNLNITLTLTSRKE
jgi:predicted nucleotide-binding protein